MLLIEIIVVGKGKVATIEGRLDSNGGYYKRKQDSIINVGRIQTFAQ